MVVVVVMVCRLAHMGEASKKGKLNKKKNA